MIAAIAWKAPIRHALYALACSLLFSLAVTASAQDSNSLQGLLEPSKPQAKVAPVQFPAAPQDSDLIKVAVTGGSTLEFFVDRSSISIAGDALVRYTLVARSAHGLSNISYEGLDCARDSWRIYGVWSAGSQRWTPNPSSDWHRVNAGGFTRIHAVLDTDYVCEGRLAAGSSAGIVAKLKRGIHTLRPTP